MVQWTAFALATVAVLVLMLVLAWLTKEATGTAEAGDGEIDLRTLSSAELLANVALTQGLFAVLLVGAILYTGVPLDALGVTWSWGYVQTGVVLGVPLGLALYAANEGMVATATSLGADPDETLRELLAPDDNRGWVVLLVGVLPVIAVFEELLFRAAMIGALAAGFDLSPVLLAVVSSAAFAVGHGMQGSVGMVVTGVLGLALAAAFIVTGSLLAVVVAHYVVNALEFVVHEGYGFDWEGIIEPGS